MKQLSIKAPDAPASDEVVSVLPPGIQDFSAFFDNPTGIFAADSESGIVGDQGHHIAVSQDSGATDLFLQGTPTSISDISALLSDPSSDSFGVFTADGSIDLNATTAPFPGGISTADTSDANLDFGSTAFPGGAESIGPLISAISLSAPLAASVCSTSTHSGLLGVSNAGAESSAIAPLETFAHNAAHAASDALPSADLAMAEPSSVTLAALESAPFNLPSLANPVPGSFPEPIADSAVGSNGATPAQVREALDESGLSVNGSGITVGVLSDSFNNLGGAAADEADGALPPAADVDVLKDYASGGTDEGRAMMQIVHDIAPGANLDFYTAFDSEQDFANGILALANAGCKVICDDVSYFDEPFFQNGVIAQAIQTVEAEGVTYISAAGNDASNGYQAAWTPISGTFDGQALTDAESFNGSLTQTVTINTEGTGDDVPLLLEWNQAYGQATSDLEILVFHNGSLVGTATNSSSGEPTNPWVLYDFTASGTYQVAIENLSGPNPGLIKEITEGDGLPATISGSNAGTVFGHAMTPGAISAGAVSAADTPAFGDNPPVSEFFSSSGLGDELLFNDNGSPISPPDMLNPVAVSGIDDINTTVPGGLSDFYGTSAASASLAGVAAVILSANPNLTAAEVELLMEDTAIPMANSAVAGAGLAQIDPAVADAFVSFLTISSSETQQVTSGLLALGDTIQSGGTQIVQVGGAASGTMISGGTQDDYGTASSTTVGSGGFQYVETGGSASGTTINSGGYQIVLSGGSASSTTIASGGNQYVESSGTASGTIVENGGYQFVETSGMASGTTINNGGYQIVLSGGSTSGTTVDSGGNQYVEASGTASGTVVESGGYQVVETGGTTSDTTVDSGGYQVILSGGTANSTTVDSGGNQYVEDSGAADNTIVDSGGYQIVLSSGTTSGTTVDGGGNQYVESSGAASGTIVDSGGFEVVETSGTTSNTTVDSGGYQVVLSGGTSNGTMVDNGGYQVVLPGGTSNGTTVDNGGNQYVENSGAANNTIVDSGGYQIVLSSGTSSGTTVDGGGNQYVEASGAASSTIVDSDGYQVVETGGTTGGTTVDSGGYQIVLSGGSASETTINGVQYVEGTSTASGTASGTIVDSGGYQFVETDGTTSGTTVDSGGYQVVSSGGSASGTTVDSGGSQYVEDSGAASSTILESGGYQFIESSGTSGGTTVDSGGYQVVLSSGTATGTTVDSGGYQIVETGGTTSGTTLSGGTEIVETGGTLTGTITFASGGGQLTLENATGSNNFQISGLNTSSDKLDLANVSFGVGTTVQFSEAGNGLSGTLTVSDGTHTAVLTLLGNYVTQDFTLSSDGNGGTIVVDPPTAATSSYGTLVSSATPGGAMPGNGSGTAAINFNMLGAVKSATLQPGESPANIGNIPNDDTVALSGLAIALLGTATTMAASATANAATLSADLETPNADPLGLVINTAPKTLDNTIADTSTNPANSTVAPNASSFALNSTGNVTQLTPSQETLGSGTQNNFGTAGSMIGNSNGAQIIETAGTANSSTLGSGIQNGNGAADPGNNHVAMDNLHGPIAANDGAPALSAGTSVAIHTSFVESASVTTLQSNDSATVHINHTSINGAFALNTAMAPQNNTDSIALMGDASIGTTPGAGATTANFGTPEIASVPLHSLTSIPVVGDDASLTSTNPNAVATDVQNDFAAVAPPEGDTSSGATVGTPIAPTLETLSVANLQGDDTQTGTAGSTSLALHGLTIIPLLGDDSNSATAASINAGALPAASDTTLQSDDAQTGTPSSASLALHGLTSIPSLGDHSNTIPSGDSVVGTMFVDSSPTQNLASQTSSSTSSSTGNDTVSVAAQNGEPTSVENLAFGSAVTANGQDWAGLQSSSHTNASFDAATQSSSLPVANSAPVGTNGEALQLSSATAGGLAADSFMFKPDFGANAFANATGSSTLGTGGPGLTTTANDFHAHLDEGQAAPAQSLFQLANSGHEPTTGFDNHDSFALATPAPPDPHAGTVAAHSFLLG